MIRQHVVPKALQGERYFRWRGGEVSRIEALTDAVFALALTLLIVSLNVPGTFDELMAAFEQVPAFAASAAILLMCWYYHYVYYRRYGFEDFVTVLLNSVLLFLVLVYVYPMKFLFSLLFEMFFGLGDALSSARESGAPIITDADWPTLMILYGGGFLGIFLLFAVMNLRAYRRQEELGLDRCEVLVTRATIRAHLISAGFGLASIALVLVNRSWFEWSGVIYIFIGPVQGLHGWWAGRGIERAAAE